MQYGKRDAKDYARAHMKGIWAAALTPFAPDLSIDEAGLPAQPAPLGRRSRRSTACSSAASRASSSRCRWPSASALSRSRSSAQQGGAGTILSCSDQNIDVVIDLARHAQAIGADYIVVHAPVLHFLHAQDETLYEYYETISEKVDIGIALWSHPDSGYLMSPELCARIADIAERGRDQVQRAARDVCAAHAAGRRQHPGEHRVGGGMARQYRRARLAALSLLDAALSAADQDRPPHARVHRPGLARRHARARAVRDSLDPVRQAFRRTRPAGEAAVAFEILAGAARPGRRAGAPADAAADRSRERGDAPRVRGVRAQARRTRARHRRRPDSEETPCRPDDCRPSTSRTGSTSTSTCSSRRSETRRCSRTPT